MATHALTQKEVLKRLGKVPLWQINKRATELSRSFIFPSFITGLSFIAKVAVHAEILGHHPDVELTYGRVTIRLTSHDIKGLTQSDFELASRIDAIQEK